MKIRVQQLLLVGMEIPLIFFLQNGETDISPTYLKIHKLKVPMYLVDIFDEKQNLNQRVAVLY